MKRSALRRLAVLVLALALAAPAWAQPVGGWTGAWQGPWDWFVRLLGGWAAKSGPCIDPSGKPVPCTPGTAAAEAARHPAAKEGICIDPSGRPMPCTPGTAPGVRPRSDGAAKEGPCIGGDGKPAPCTPGNAALPVRKARPPTN